MRANRREHSPIAVYSAILVAGLAMAAPGLLAISLQEALLQSGLPFTARLGDDELVVETRAVANGSGAAGREIHPLAPTPSRAHAGDLRWNRVFAADVFGRIPVRSDPQAAH